MDATGLHAFDIALRGGLAVLLVFVAAVLLRDRGSAVGARLGAAFAGGVALHLVLGMPGVDTPPAAWQAPLFAIRAGNAVVLWALAGALFDDDFRLRGRHVAAWLAMAAVGGSACAVAAGLGPPWPVRFGMVIDAAAAGFALLAAAEAVSTWRADLVERRRRLRTFIVAAAAGYTVVLLLTKLLVPAHVLPAAAGLVEPVTTGLVVLAIAWRLIGLAAGHVFDPAAEPAAAAQATAPEPQDPRLVAALQRLMTQEHAYRDEGLTIGSLAARLDVPEYKLRRLINQGLGWRNFNAFLNRHRLDEAKRALADPARAGHTVLTIALDAGFQSIGPFNRAFKADTALTPTEFRRRHAAATPASRPLALADSGIG